MLRASRISILSLAAVIALQPVSASADRCSFAIKDWLKAPGMITPVDGLEFEGIVLDNPSNLTNSSVFLTTQFFADAFPAELPMRRPEIVSQAAPRKLHTYRYYPVDATSERASRGSGRDHLISADQEGADHYLSVKGSGTNALYSATNQSQFGVGNFRRNGLQNPDESTQEYILSKIFRDLGIPTEEHAQFLLLPEQLQLPMRLTQSDFSKLAVQTVRRLTGARESHLDGQPPSETERLRLAAALYFGNVGHGAINNENLTADGKILDLGHITMGYPFISGHYRCAICASMRGSSADGTMVGILDHYFPAPTTPGMGPRIRPAYQHLLSRDQLQKMLGMMGSMLDGKTDPIAIEPHEAEAIESIFDETIRYTRYSHRNTPWDESMLSTGPVKDAMADLLGITGLEFSNKFLPARVAVSIRLLMQTAGLKQSLPENVYAETRRRLLRSVHSFESAKLETALGVFERLFERRKIPADQMRKLYQEYLPTDVMLSRIRKELASLQRFDQAPDMFKRLIAQLSAPIENSPAEYAAKLGRFLDVMAVRSEH